MKHSFNCKFKIGQASFIGSGYFRTRGSGWQYSIDAYSEDGGDLVELWQNSDGAETLDEAKALLASSMGMQLFNLNSSVLNAQIDGD